MTLAAAGRRARSLSPLQLDALLFAGSAAFAVALHAGSNLAAHLDWSGDAIGGYLGCAVLAGLAGWRRPRREYRVRVAITVLCGVLVALLPLCLMVAARGGTTHETNVLPETAVIERAGARLDHGRDPYVAELVHNRLVGRVAGVPRYEAFFPYFPLMAAFGLPAALGLGALGDARWYFALVTLVVGLAGLRLARAPPGRALRAAQVLFVLPTGALFLAGGGDDLPVLAITLLGAALVYRRRNVLGAVSFAVVMAMKLLAWPLALLCVLVVALRDSTREAVRMLVVISGIVLAVLVPFAAWGPHVFFENTIAFPLGLSGVNSPAASPLPGHIVVSLLPSAERVLLVGLVIVGSPILVWWLARRPPRSVAAACRLTAVVTIVVMCVAPATRVGYVVYPVNFLVWSWLFTREGDATCDSPASGDLDDMSLSTTKSRSS